jgi:hypothetical protein
MHFIISFISYTLHSPDLITEKINCKALHCVNSSSYIAPDFFLGQNIVLSTEQQLKDTSYINGGV